MKNLGLKLKEYRLQKGLSIKNIARILNISYTTISHIERNKLLPSENLLKKLSKELDANLEELQILAGRIPEDLKKILYAFPVEAPMFLREAFSNYAAESLFSSSINLKKELEQFFTPYAIAAGMLELINAKNGAFIDPSCGNGIFLSAAKARNLKTLGCDIDPACIESIKHSGIKGKFITGNAFKLLWDYENSFDFVAGNPPFSAQENLITDANLLNKFELGKGRKAQSTEVLFLELFIRLLKPDGKFSIILPESLCSVKPLQYVRDWLSKNISIDSIISLPRNLFKGTTSKCVILSGRKSKLIHNLVKYAICNAEPDFLSIVREIKNTSNSIDQTELSKLSDWRPESLSIISIKDGSHLSDLVKLRTGFALYGEKRYFNSEFEKNTYQLILAKNFLPVAGLNMNRVKYFINRNNPAFSSKAVLYKGEILFVRVGAGCCGRVAVFDSDINAQADDWIHILTPKEKINSWYIAAWIASSFGQRLLKLMSYGVGTVSISKTTLGQLLVPRFTVKRENEIARLLKSLLKRYPHNQQWQQSLDNIFKANIKNLEGLISSPKDEKSYPSVQRQVQHALVP